MGRPPVSARTRSSFFFRHDPGGIGSETMNDLINGLKRRISEEPYFGLAISAGILTTSIGLGLYAYLGTFSRYGSDDYCLSAFFLQDDLLSQLIRRYFVVSGRYMNILFIGLADKVFGWHNVSILPPLMLGLLVTPSSLYADLLPALIVGRFGASLVLQTLDQGMDRAQGMILDCLAEVAAPRGIVARNDVAVRVKENLPLEAGVVRGEVPERLAVARHLAVVLGDELLR